MLAWPLMKERFLMTFVSLGIWCTGPWLRFTVDYASHVRFLSFRLTVNFLKYVLTEPSSFAIWNMNKVIVAFSAGVWMTNISLMSICEFCPISRESIQT